MPDVWCCEFWFYGLTFFLIFFLIELFYLCKDVHKPPEALEISYVALLLPALLAGNLVMQYSKLKHANFSLYTRDLPVPMRYNVTSGLGKRKTSSLNASYATRYTLCTICEFSLTY